MKLPARPHGLVDPSSLEDFGGGLSDPGALALNVGDEIGDGITHGEYRYRINAAPATAFMLLHERGVTPHKRGAMTPADRIRNWLIETAEKRNLSYAEWARRAGLAPSTVQRAVKPTYEFITSSRTLAKLAEVAGVDPPTVEGFTDPKLGRGATKNLPIRYEVGAGIWRSIDEVDVFYGYGAVPADPNFEGFDQWMERVVGDSMDKEYLPGDQLHVVDASGMGYQPRPGDHVVIERRMDGGLRERSVKEVRMTHDGGVEFWAKSNNPRWAKPITASNGRESDNGEVAIVGFVIGSYRPRTHR